MTKKASQDFVPTVQWANISIIIKAAHLGGAETKKAHSIEWAFRNNRPVPARDGGDTHMIKPMNLIKY